MSFSKVPIFNVRLLGVIVAVLIALSKLLSPEPIQRFTRSQDGRAEMALQFLSFAFSPTGEHIATTDLAGHVSLRGLKSGEQSRRRVWQNFMPIGGRGGLRHADLAAEHPGQSPPVGSPPAPCFRTRHTPYVANHRQMECLKGNSNSTSALASRAPFVG
jgi:hypothetical protein